MLRWRGHRVVGGLVFLALPLRISSRAWFRSVGFLYFIKASSISRVRLTCLRAGPGFLAAVSFTILSRRSLSLASQCAVWGVGVDFPTAVLVSVWGVTLRTQRSKSVGGAFCFLRNGCYFKV